MTRRRRRTRRMTPAAIEASRRNLQKARAARKSSVPGPGLNEQVNAFPSAYVKNYGKAMQNIARTGTPKAKAAAMRMMGIRIR